MPKPERIVSLGKDFSTSPYQQQVLETLRFKELTADQIAFEIELSTPHCRLILHDLELQKKIKRHKGKYYLWR